MYTSSAAKPVSAGAKVPLTLRTGRWANIYLDNNEIKLIQTPVEGGAPGEMEALGEGVYAIFCYARCLTGSHGVIALTMNGATITNAYMTFDSTHLNHSQMTIRDFRMDTTFALTVQSGSIITLADGINASVVMFKIADLP